MNNAQLSIWHINKPVNLQHYFQLLCHFNVQRTQLVKEAEDREIQLSSSASSNIGIMYSRTVLLKQIILLVFL